MNSFVKTFIFALTCFLFQSEVSKSQQWLWADHIGGDYLDGSIGTTDKNGNFFMAGSFYGTHCQFLNQTLHAIGMPYNSMFLAKYDNNGTEKWVRQFNSGFLPQNCNDGMTSVIVDDFGFVYITGLFYQSATFGQYNLTSENGDVFLAKYNTDGDCIWAIKAGGSGTDWGTGLAVDSSGGVYVCGQNLSPAIFGTIPVDAGGFMAKYDSNGICQWAKKIVSYTDLGSYSADVIFSGMTLVKDRLIACGYGGAGSSFSIDTVTFTHPGLEGHILCCFDLDGALKWTSEALTEGCVFSGINLTTDSIGNIFVAGAFGCSVGGADVSINFSDTVLVSNSTTSDLFIAKYSSSGNVIWARKINSDLISPGGTIVSDKYGNTYVSGAFKGTNIFGPDILVSETNKDMFLARYSPEGECYGGIHFGLAGGSEVGLDITGKPILVGTFAGTVNIGSQTFTSRGGWDIFLAKCDNITGIGETKKAASNQLLIYANPNEGKCTVKFPDEFLNEKHLTLSIYDSQGKLIQSVPVDNVEGKVSLNIQAEARGVYNVVLSNGKKNYTGKIVFN